MDMTQESLREQLGTMLKLSVFHNFQQLEMTINDLMQ